ncbi:uncharacterized protein [Centruroides vittatus]|uniref:uncharacterized protein n=1 Tax=Centruroides vittatus TaxID=120091 RepID=UPI00350FB46E
MKKIVITILLVYVSCTLANSFVKRSFGDICALSRDQLSVFADCVDDSLSDESRDVIHGYLGCIGFSSIFDFLEKSCVTNDDMDDETLLKAFLCSYEYEERLKTVVTREDENKCLEKVTPAIVE